jgi:hypothetical protein
LIVTRQTVQFDTGSDAWVDALVLLDDLEATGHPTQQLEEATAWYRREFLEGFGTGEPGERRSPLHTAAADSRGDVNGVCPGCVAFSDDEKRTLVAAEDVTEDSGATSLTLWDLETGQQIRRFDITHDVANTAMNADGSRALTGSVTGFVAILWDVATGQAKRRFEGHDGPILHVAFGPD